MADNSVEIKVMMFGGRRCGKTSVLAAMQSCFEDKFGKGNLVISADDDDTMLKLEEKNREIENYFHNQGNTKEFVPDSNPTDTITEYKFNIGLKHKSSENIVVNFIDYPGEWLQSPKKWKELSDIMKKVHIIIVAIDSPHLMELTHSDTEDAVGQFNDLRNYSRRIGEGIKRNFTAKNGLPAKMLLFVPLKCEKYYHANQMDILNKKIHKAYKETFNFFTNNPNPFEVAITPILTCGDEDKGVAFSRFERDNDGEILLDPTGTPQKAIYIFTKKMSEPKPKYCEQPMVYVLAYVLEMAKTIMERQKADEGFFSGIWRWFKENFGNLATIKDFMAEHAVIKSELKKSGSGYEIYSNPLHF